MSQVDSSTVEIQLTQGKVAVVDMADCDLVAGHKWKAVCNYGTWYAARHGCKSNGEPHTVYMHRQVIGAKAGEVVDHRDRDGLNNKRSNIRLCTVSQNQMNKDCKAKSSGYKGVFKTSTGFIARIVVRGRRVYLGFFKDPADAAKAYEKAAVELHGDFALARGSYEPV